MERRKHLPDLPSGANYVNMTDINSGNPDHPGERQETTAAASELPMTPGTAIAVSLVPAPPDTGCSAAHSKARRGDLVAFAELLYFAYRQFTSDPDAILARYEFGRAHHRVLHFVHRNPGLKVAELLDILKITKQSLARVLKELRDKGFIVQRPGPDDLRERRLHATNKGARLAEKLMELQVKRIGDALSAAGDGAEAVTHRFLKAMIEAGEQNVADPTGPSGVPD